MNRIIAFLMIIGISTCHAQEIKGVWMSYNNYTIDEGKGTRSRDEGVLIDFDNSTLGMIDRDTLVPIKIDLKKSMLFTLNNEVITEFKRFGKDSLEIDMGRNKMHVFRPLDLRHKLKIDKNILVKILINSRFQEIDEDYRLKFKNEIHHLNRGFARNVDVRYLDCKEGFIGYWYVKELQGNLFLVFTTSEDDEQHIYQVTKVGECRIELIALQEEGSLLKGLTELVSCKE